MLFQNIKQSVRGMLKDKTFTLMNITGFAVGFAVLITITLFAYKEYTVNDFIPNSKEVYRLVDTEHKTTRIDNSVVPLLKEQFPEIKEIVPVFYFSMEGSSIVIKSESNKKEIFPTNIISTNDDFFSFFGIKILISKTEKAFNELKSVVIPKSTALKLFGKIDVIDEQIVFFGNKLNISAVVEDIPAHATLGADVFFNDTDTSLGMGGNGGVKTGYFYPRDIYVSLNKDCSIDKLLMKLNNNFPKNKSNAKIISAQSVRDIYFAESLKSNTDKKGNKSLIFIFITIAVFTLIMAIFNYANFSISRQMQNLKASGIRITNGATRVEIRFFYIIDVAISVGLAFVLGMFISWLLMPLTKNIFAVNLNPIWLLKPEFIALTAGILLTVILLSSILPVGFISRLELQSLFGKTQLKSRKHPLKSIMTIMQLAISMVLVVGLIVVNKQLNYVKTADIGFEKEHLLRVNLPYPFTKKEVLKNTINKLPFIDKFSFTCHSPGAGWSRTELKKESGEYLKVRTMLVDENFLETFGMKLLQGRKFLEGDMDNSCYISETTLKEMNWDSFEGKKLNGSKIIGIVNDININSLHTGVVPVGYLFYTKHTSALNVRLKAGNIRQQLEALEETWNKATEGETFKYQFYDDYFDSLYKKEERQAKALTLFVFIAFIITCMGLLSQVLQNTQNRIKEIGIRKINGASIKEVMLLLNKEFLWTVVIAFVIATPIAYYTMNRWLENFAYKTELSWWIFILAGISALLIALLTVSWESWRTATRNPVEALRYE